MQINKLEPSINHKTRSKPSQQARFVMGTFINEIMQHLGRHHILFGCSLVFSSFINSLLFKDKFFLALYSKSTTYKSMKTLNYGQKVHSVYLPKGIEKL